MTISGRAVKRLVFAAVVLSIGVVAPTRADYKAGYEAYKADDFAAALSAWLPLANQDDALAQHALGIMYKRGRGVLQDDGEAVAWFRKAAEQGLAAGQYDLGRMFSVGRGVPRDDAQAVKWLRLAAAQGLGAAQVTLGILYARGRGAPDDDPQALGWIRKAAEQGDAEAAKRLAELDPAAAAAVDQPAAPATYRDLVTAVQMRLADLGLDPGPPDGVPGSKTVGAIEEFEKRAGLPVTGAVSEDILMRLDTEAAARMTGDPAAPAPAGVAAKGQAFGDWIIACAGGQRKQARRCFARQIQVLKSQEGGGGNRRLIDARVGFLGPKGQAAFVAMLPLGVYIPAAAALRIDERQPIPLRLEFCTRMGCRAVTLLDEATLAAIQGSTALTVRFSPGFTGKVASIRLSPKGLTEAVKALR